MEEKKQNPPKIKLHNSLRELTLELWKYLIFSGLATVLIIIVTSGLMTSSRLALGAIGAVCVIFAGVVLYANTWTYGDRDANFVQFGRCKRDPLKGVKLGCLVSLPTFLLNIPLALSKAEILPFDFLPVYRFLAAPLWPLINMIHPYGAVAHEATEATELLEAFPATPAMEWGQFGLIVLLPLIYVFFCWLGYEMGYRRISLGFRLVYGKKAEAGNNDKPKKS
ncbi:MAG: hypothetical protein IJD13_10015 [Oscillospiraceae bacterium]|nr:hypothetical protein [Oscillospiraceae bacterium]